MSRVAKKAVAIPEGVKLSIDGSVISAQGKQGAEKLELHPEVSAVHEGGFVKFSVRHESARMLAGTMRALTANLIHGVHKGFEKKLILSGIAYRAQLKNATLVLQLGYSHPIEYQAPPGVKLDLPSQTEIIVKGINKQQVGQVAADIRSHRPPEPYKGKGIKYDGEFIFRKEGKKKAAS